jgi:hypothetical protein
MTNSLLLGLLLSPFRIQNSLIQHSQGTLLLPLLSPFPPFLLFSLPPRGGRLSLLSTLYRLISLKPSPWRFTS